MDRSDGKSAESASDAAARRSALRDRAGLFVQLVLTLIGLHATLAIGFTVHWSGQPIVSYRQPIAGLLVMLLGTGLRWAISPRFRQWCADAARRDATRVRECSAGNAGTPWRAALLWVFVPALLICQSNGRTLGSGDTAPMVQTALSMLADGDINLDEFVDAAAPPYYVCEVDGHYYSRFSLGPAITAVPLIKIAQWLGGDLSDAVMRQRLEKLVASVIGAATATLMFLLLLRLIELTPAIVLTVFFGLASQNWSIASQALWQHGPVALCVAATLLLEYRGRGTPGVGTRVLQGLSLGFALGCRPTAAIGVTAFAVYVAIKQWRCLPALVVGAALAYAPFAAVHVHTYHSLLGPYAHAASETKWGANLLVSLPGNLISPARGLLIYQPLFVLVVLIGIPRLTRRIGVVMAAALAAWFVVHVVVVSYYRHWWGGHAWGPRFMTELMPVLVVLAAPAVAWLWRRRSGRLLVAVLIAWSVCLQALGVYGPGAQRWMKEPVDVDQAPGRLWDWSDPPIAHFWTRTG